MPERGKASTWILSLVHRRAVDTVRREQRRRADALERAPEPLHGSVPSGAVVAATVERAGGVTAPTTPPVFTATA